MDIVTDQLRLMAAGFEDEVAFKDVTSGLVLRFGTWERRSNQLARGLIGLGVRPGDRVQVVDDHGTPVADGEIEYTSPGPGRTYDCCMRSADTSPEAHDQQVRAMRKFSPAQRVELALEMSGAILEMVADGIRLRHPAYDEESVTWALRRMRVGDQLFRRHGLTLR